MTGKAEGSVYTRKDGRGVATLYDHTGKRRAFYGRTEKEAITKREKARAEGVPVGGSLSVQKWLETWLEGATLSTRTKEGYQSKINRLIPLIGAKRLDRLSPDDIDRAYKVLRNDLSERSVLHCHRVLHTALEAARKRRRIVTNPASLVDAPRPPKYRANPFTADHARTLLQEAAERRNGARWWLALLLGLRNAEALGLRWVDVHLDKNTITVSHQLQRHIGQGLVLVPTTKTRKDRTLPLPAELANMLRNMPRTHELVFVDEHNRPISPERDRRDWIELLAACRIPYVRAYETRHTAATLLMEAGIHPRVVADILGHSTTALTLGTYTHVADPMLVHAVDALTAALDSTKESRRTRKLRSVGDDGGEKTAAG